MREKLPGQEAVLYAQLVDVMQKGTGRTWKAVRWSMYRKRSKKRRSRRHRKERRRLDRLTRRVANRRQDDYRRFTREIEVAHTFVSVEGLLLNHDTLAAIPPMTGTSLGIRGTKGPSPLTG